MYIYIYIFIYLYITIIAMYSNIGVYVHKAMTLMYIA